MRLATSPGFIGSKGGFPVSFTLEEDGTLAGLWKFKALAGATELYKMQTFDETSTSSPKPTRSYEAYTGTTPGLMMDTYNTGSEASIQGNVGASSLNQVYLNNYNDAVRTFAAKWAVFGCDVITTVTAGGISVETLHGISNNGYIRIYDGDGDIYVEQWDQSPDGNQLMVFPYQFEDANYHAVLSCDYQNNAFAATAMSTSRAFDQLTGMVRQVDSGLTWNSSRFNYRAIWIRASAFSSDKLETGSNANGYWAKFYDDDGNLIRLIEALRYAGGAHAPVVTLPVELPIDKNYAAIAANTYNTTANREMSPIITSTTQIQVYQHARAVNSTTGYDAILEWVDKS